MLDDIRIGHWNDPAAVTGLTVFVPPADAVVAAEVHGQNAGTLNLALLGPRGSASRAAAVVLTGGSIFGLEAAAHLAVRLGERSPELFPPIVSAAVVYDLMLGDRVGPEREAAIIAYDTAEPASRIASGAVGVGTGVVVGGALLGTAHGVKGGFGSAGVDAGGAEVRAWAVVNSVGDVMGEDGRVLAGVHADGEFVGVLDALGRQGQLDWGRATTLVVIGTDAKLNKLEAWQLAQAGHAGIAHAIVPASTGGDGDTSFAIATGTVPSPGMLALETAATLAVAGAIRDAVRSARTTAGVPGLDDLPFARD